MAEWVMKGSLKGPQGDPGETPDLSAYATTESLAQAVAAEADAREQADELLQANVDDMFSPQSPGATYKTGVVSKSSGNSIVTRVADDSGYGVVKFASDADFKAYMGMS